MKKIFFSCNELRDNTLKMAHDIYMSGFLPDIFFVLLRGGAVIGNIISEYFSYRGHGDIHYAAVAAKSYSGVGEQDELDIAGWTHHPEDIDKDLKILIIDDIFDSGVTINALVKMLHSYDFKPDNIKTAVHDYKEFTYKKYASREERIIPDFYCKKHVINSEDENFWIHYLSHELIGLQDNEFEEYYYKESPGLRRIFDEK